MKIISAIILSFASFLLIPPASRADEYSPASIIQLGGRWEFRNADSLQWRDASVPGNVHADLLRHGLIPDPFYSENEGRVQWAEECAWEYRCRFDLPPDFLDRDRIELVFHGLDTYATVYANDQFLFRADNMFRTWRADAGTSLRPGENVLLIRFDPVTPIEKERQEELGYEIPGGLRAFTRKAGFHYGWDWGPRLVTCGVWRPVEIRAWNTTKIHSLQLVQESLQEDTARLCALFEVESLRPKQPAVLHIHDTRKEVLLEKGIHTYPVDFEIAAPERWWPNGWGEPHLYEFQGDLVIGRDTIDTAHERIGLRTIELVQEPDSLGRTFYFRVNGIPFFAKGANYVPQDNLQNRVTSERYEALIQAAADAHMNMLRVWGGGIYEDDIFYDLCDQYGILVWQDFMFACAMVPGDTDFLANVEAEAADNIKRLRNHPSIALWCGNNESSEGWHRWGWQDALTGEQRNAVWSAYRELFQRALPSIVDSLVADGIYWETSPEFGRGDPRHQFEGDAHYWGVWHDAEPFEVLEQKVPRFMSEFGFQSLPDLRTIRQFAPPNEMRLDSKAMQNHQKHPRGFQLIDEYMKRDYRRPEDFAGYGYVSQVLQAEGIRCGIEAQRRAKPFCMGTMYWQLNDCWPAVSWSSIDYYGRWKALHYAVKRAYGDILVSVEDVGDALHIFTVSDRLTDTPADITVALMDFHGDELRHWRMTHVIRANASDRAGQISKSELAGFDPKNSLLYVKVNAKDWPVAPVVYLFDRPKNLLLPKPNFRCRPIEAAGGYEIEINSDAFAKNVFLRTGVEGRFTDNFFDMIPGETKTVFFKTHNALTADDLVITSLVDGCAR